VIYYIACTETRRVKIGFTSHNPHARLRALQTGSAAPLTLIAVESGDKDHERKLHKLYAAQRVHGEWFEMSEALFKHICFVVWMQAKHSMLLGEPIEEWVRLGLISMHTVDPLPGDLAALIE